MLVRILSLVVLSFAPALAAPAIRSSGLGQTVTLDNGTFTGISDGKMVKFYGLPYAKPPTGDLRFRPAVPNDPYVGSHKATSYGLACPQQPVTIPELPPGINTVVTAAINAAWGVVFPDGEDCLTVNVVAPKGATPSSKLPVVLWLFGGGFEFGGTQIYDGGLIVSRSIQLNEPIIFVSFNYRLSLFGFLGGKEVKAAGVANLGLLDQREAMRWIQKYISNFGGDPTKVTLWGQSAGAISAALQMTAFGGDSQGLFRGAFMESGSAIPMTKIDADAVQKEYNSLVTILGCDSAADSLQCLRQAPYETLKSFMLASSGIFQYTSLDLVWVPRIDGTVLTEAPMKLVQEGKVANVPFVTGDVQDEGTLFSFSSLNITTDEEFGTWFQQTYLPVADDDDMQKLMAAYPSEITQGSPYGTLILNALTPQFKRIASIQGDLSFQAPRRFFLQNLSGKQKAWSFLTTRGKLTPFLGSFHTSDLLNVYGIGELKDYLINFAHNLDPNQGSRVFNWPQYTTDDPTMLLLQDGLLFRLGHIQDTYRQQGMSLLAQLAMKYEELP